MHRRIVGRLVYLFGWSALFCEYIGLKLNIHLFILSSILLVAWRISVVGVGFFSAISHDEFFIAA